MLEVVVVVVVVVYKKTVSDFFKLW